MPDTYIQYGIASDLANKLASIGLPKTTFEKTSKKNLIEKYGLNENEIKLVKELILRKPIEQDVVNDLLENSNFTCCVCHGTKSQSYIIHHIEEYSKNQDNDYHNLAVLCPADHDLAHKTGGTLTLVLTAKQITNAKEKWEKKVKEVNIEKASKNGNIFEVDFLNIPRILEVYFELFRTIPDTEYSQSLYDKKLLNQDGSLNDFKIAELNKNPATPFIFFAPNGSTMLRFHFYDVFKSLLQRLDFVDLDTLLNKTSIKGGIIGTYCYYVGGLYSSKLPKQITNDSECMTFFLKKKNILVEWLVDPKYFCSNSAKHRTHDRNIYMIYGKIRNVNIRDIDNKRHVVIDIRPYCFGLPELQKDRTPTIAYRDMFDEYLDDEE